MGRDGTDGPNRPPSEANVKFRHTDQRHPPEFATLSDLEADEFLEESREGVRSHVGKLTEYYLTLGQYDAAIITESPDTETATQALFTVLQDGRRRNRDDPRVRRGRTRDLIGKL